MNPAKGTPARDAPTVSILIPAKNEAEAIPRTLGTLPLETLAMMGFNVETVVVDGRSHDATSEVARRHGAHRVLDDPGRGKALAFLHARQHVRGDYILMLDADGTYAPDALPRALHQMAFEGADVVMGRRRVQDGAMTGWHRIGNALLTHLAQALYLHPCPDLCTGLWGFRTDRLRMLPIEAHGFELEAELFAQSVRHGLRVEAVPVDYLPRTGATKLENRDALRIVLRLLLTRVRPLDTRRTARPAQRSAIRGREARL